MEKTLKKNKMHHYHFAGYDFYISDSLRPVIDTTASQFLIVHPINHTICFVVKLIETNRLRLDGFFNMRYEMLGKSVYIYQSVYDTGDEIDEEDHSISV
ncbi:hypothetical protein [Streptococcus ruminantium]|uniref:hypothetical protein n=1 Tax=Streptococcus ruminantium TaxID=1917441 RepID=UPI0012DF34B8|nr:hypothetical protein [Streptococcus ruminantium]